MALLAEEIVEEWLNRQGYFTIRGIKMGVQEIDLLAVQLPMDGKVKCRRSDKKALMAKLWNGEWSSELVVNVVKSEGAPDAQSIIPPDFAHEAAQRR